MSVLNFQWNFWILATHIIQGKWPVVIHLVYYFVCGGNSTIEGYSMVLLKIQLNVYDIHLFRELELYLVYNLLTVTASCICKGCEENLKKILRGFKGNREKVWVLIVSNTLMMMNIIINDTFDIIPLHLTFQGDVSTP